MPSTQRVDMREPSARALHGEVTVVGTELPRPSYGGTARCMSHGPFRGSEGSEAAQNVRQ